MSTTPPVQDEQARTRSTTDQQHAHLDEEESLSDLEREILEEYVKLKENLDMLAPLLSNLASDPTANILDGLRLLERKTSLVSTLLKASVYSIVLQQEMFEGEGASMSEADGTGLG